MNDKRETAQEEEVQDLHIPENDFYVEFRIMTKPFPNESWSEWMFYPSGISLKRPKEALKENGVMFVDDIAQVKSKVREETMFNVTILDLPNDVFLARQDSQKIKNELGFGPWDKIPARFASSVQVRLMENNFKNKLQPSTLKEIFEELSGQSAVNQIESEIDYLK